MKRVSTPGLNNKSVSLLGESSMKTRIMSGRTVLLDSGDQDPKPLRPQTHISRPKTPMAITSPLAKFNTFNTRNNSLVSRKSNVIIVDRDSEDEDHWISPVTQKKNKELAQDTKFIKDALVRSTKKLVSCFSPREHRQIKTNNEMAFKESLNKVGQFIGEKEPIM